MPSGTQHEKEPSVTAGRGALPERSIRPMFLYGATFAESHEAARRLHAHSPRSGRIFIVAALRDIPRALREEALFGKEKGWLIQANGGTILLDEIDCLHPTAQTRLADCLARKEHPTRVILASRHDRGFLLERGELGEGLHRWLSALDASQTLGPERIRAICRLPFAGRCRGGLARALEQVVDAHFETVLEAGGGNMHAYVVEEVERPLIRRVLKKTGGNQLRAASILGVNRNTLRKRIRDLAIDLPKGENV